MVTKKSHAAKPVAIDNKLAEAIRESAHQIWMAGLGAFAKAQEQRDKVVDKVFDTLVREGNAIQKRTKALTEEKMGEVAEQVSKVTGQVVKVAEEMQKGANERWDKLESVFEARVERALRRLGVPTTKDLEALHRRLDAVAPRAKPAAKKAVKKAAKKVARKPAKAAKPSA